MITQFVFPLQNHQAQLYCTQVSITKMQIKTDQYDFFNKFRFNTVHRNTV